jgi:glycogen debranching enzyme
LDARDIRPRLWADLDRLRAPEGYLRAGAPRFATLFGRDSLISAWQTLSIDPSIAAATLRILAALQGKRLGSKSEEEPGKILHEHWFKVEDQKELPDWEFPYYGSIDSTPLYLIVADAYLDSTNDVAILDELWPALQAAYKWMVELGDRDGDGYLEYSRRNPRGLLHQGWKDGSEDHLHIAPPVALVEVQGYAIGAHRAFARLARRRGFLDAAENAERFAGRLCDAVNRDFWMPEARYFALALDGSKRQRKAITSNPGHLLLVDAVARDRVDDLVERLLAKDMFTAYGIRTHSTSEPDFNPFGYHTGSIWPHDNWFIYKGLMRQGRESEAFRIRAALIRVWEELGKIPELWTVDKGALVDLSRSGSPTPANPLQAWSSAAVISMLADNESTSP